MLFGLRFEFSGEFKITLAQVPSDCSVAKLRGLFSVLLLDLSLTLATADHFPLLQTPFPLGFPTFLLFFQALAALLKAVCPRPSALLILLSLEQSPCCGLDGLEYTAESQYYFSIPTLSVSPRLSPWLKRPPVGWPWPTCLPGPPHTLWSSHTAVLSGPQMR